LKYVSMREKWRMCEGFWAHFLPPRGGKKPGFSGVPPRCVRAWPWGIASQSPGPFNPLRGPRAARMLFPFFCALQDVGSQPPARRRRLRGPQPPSCPNPQAVNKFAGSPRKSADSRFHPCVTCWQWEQTPLPNQKMRVFRGAIRVTIQPLPPGHCEPSRW
jgi:hypothetical protein